MAKDQRRRTEEVVEVIAGKRDFDWLLDDSPRYAALISINADHGQEKHQQGGDYNVRFIQSVM